MKRTMRKELFRVISGSIGRFLSIFIMVAIGCGFYAGVKSTGDEMRTGADRYFDQSSLMDGRLTSPLGFDDQMVEAISQTDGVSSVMPGCEVVSESLFSGEIRTIRVQSISAGEKYSLLNIPTLVDGRMPQKADECVIDHRAIKSGKYEIGQTIDLQTKENSAESLLLKEGSFTIVGSIDTPVYLSISWSAISIGSKEPDFNIFVPMDAFSGELFSDIYLLYDRALWEFCYSDEYLEITGTGRKSVEKAARYWAANRLSEIALAVQSGESEISEELIATYLESGTESFYYYDRESIQGYTLFHSDTKRVDGLAKVFPLFFFLVSSLVCLTTMTRMVDEERLQIGSLKALGYSNTAVASKYLLYAALASSMGGFFGLAVGFQVFPRTIFTTYLIMYRLPSIHPVFHFDYAWYTLLISVMLTLAATLYAIMSTLRSGPAELMRPKSPRGGQRVFLERMSFVWKKMNFTHKVTVRNLFRYKKRFLMTTIGIAGCTALILTGFGLKDSVTGVADKQFGDILVHDMRVYLRTPVTDPEADSSIAALSSMPGVREVLPVYADSVEVRNKDGKKLDASCLASRNPTVFQEYYNLRTRTNGKSLKLQKDQVIISEKLSTLLDLNEGDMISLTLISGDKISVEIYGIAENYIDHYVFMSEELLAEMTGEELSENVVLLKTEKLTEAEREKLKDLMLDTHEYAAVVDYSRTRMEMHEIFSSMDYVVLVLTISAFLLAVVVLYNLTNINIKERIREIATLKVLGFYDGEVSAYVFRENALLTIIGAGLGLLVGIFMHLFVIRTAEVDMIMFERQISPGSFLMAFVLTCAFSFGINLIMHFYLKHVKMVESLKSVE
jgi:putative ABC transport system permease protein